MYPVQSLARDEVASLEDLGGATSNGMYLSIIIPAYNEEKRIGPTLEAIFKYLEPRGFEYEIIVVNNNSKDGTEQLVKEYQTRMPTLRLVNESGPGKGHAVTRGMLMARGELRVFTDADNSTTMDHIERMIPHAEKGYDVVIGSLAVPGAIVLRGEPWYRILAGKLGNLFIQFFAVWGIWDTQRGFKMFTARAAEDIFRRLTTFGWGFDVEVLVIARTRNYKIKEVPITWNNDPDSKVNMWAYPQVLLQTLRIFWNRIQGVYSSS